MAHSQGQRTCSSGNAGGPNNWGQVKKLVPSDGAAGNEFGVSVSLHGDTALVGASRDDDNGLSSGSAYIFERNAGGPGNWGEVKKLLASDGVGGDEFGNSVSLYDDVALIGANRDDDNGAQSGAAYIFERNAGGPNNWGEVKKLLPSDGATGDLFGWNVSLSEDTAVVGALSDDDNGLDSGSAYVFQRDAGGPDNWGEVEKLLSSDGASGDRFGVSVSRSGDTTLIGASGDDDNGSDSGSAYVLRVDDTDGDGIPDDEDDCSNSDLSPTVVIDGCDSGVENDLFGNGCTIADQVHECAMNAGNHGQFVSCVAHLTNDLKKAGVITGQEKGAIQSCAAQANLP